MYNHTFCETQRPTSIVEEHKTKYMIKYKTPQQRIQKPLVVGPLNKKKHNEK
jgi:hypothetical protein